MPKTKAMILNIDSLIENADWTKTKWDLPKYKSKEFFELLKLSKMTLTQFKKLPIYKAAKNRGEAD